MWDTLQKLEYRAKAGISEAKVELVHRLADREALPLSGIHGETLYLTGISALRKRAAELNLLYTQLPTHRGVKETILLDAHSSATIEGARTTVENVRKSFRNPTAKDDIMVVNTIRGCDYAYRRPITEGNIRRLWDTVVNDVCENEGKKGTLYRDGMVYVGSASRVIHAPAAPEIIPDRMAQWFSFIEPDSPDLLLRSFAAHFYFVYIHPFCDGNGRMARILNASQLYHGGYRKMKQLPLSTAINKQLNGYYGSIENSEAVLNDGETAWLDVSVFVSYMLDVFERCLIDAALSKNKLTPSEASLLERMNKAGLHAEITAAKAAKILDRSDRSARAVLNSLVEKGYLSCDSAHVPHLYRFKQQFHVQESEVEAVLREAIRLHPDNPHPRTVLADMYARQGRIAEAEELYQAVLALNPGNAYALQGLAKLR